MDKFEINIGIFGCVSVGKSTFLNAITGQQFSDAKINKTTMVPQVYTQIVNETSDIQTIQDINKKINDVITKDIDNNNFSLEKCQPVYHNIENFFDFFDPEIIDPNLKISIYDIPGLNDSTSKDIYFEWVRQNIKLFDIIIFMTDINRGLNNSDEIDILKLLMESIKKYNIKMICLMNKCDNIYFDHKQNDLVFEEKEQENIYIQANNILVDIAKNSGIEQNNNDFTPFFPISSENCFIYRTLVKNPPHKLDPVYKNRLCKNECGSSQWKKMSNEEKDQLFDKIITTLQNSYNNKILDTGYLAVKSVIHNTIITNKTTFAMNHIDYEMKILEKGNIENVSEYIKMIEKYTSKLSQIEMFKIKISYNAFWNHIQVTISNYIESINKLNIKILKGKNYIDFKDFEALHAILLTYCMNLATLIETIQIFPDYPKDFVRIKQKELVGKLLYIYDQLCTIDPVDQTHICPTNILQYLEIIKTYVPEEFNTYALKFLKIMGSPKCKHPMTYPNELLELVMFISENTNKDTNAYRSIISAILINRQPYIHDKYPDQYFHYLVRMKKRVRQINKKIPEYMYCAYDILYEVINKNISSYLSICSIPNIYKQEIDYNKINNALNKFFGSYYSLMDLSFEDKMLNAFTKKIE